MIISEIQSKKAHWSCYSLKFKAPSDFGLHPILAKSLSLSWNLIFAIFLILMNPQVFVTQTIAAKTPLLQKLVNCWS